MSLLTVSLLIDGLILLVNFPALVKNEKKPFVPVQTPENQDGWAGAGGGGGAGRALGRGRGGAGGASSLDRRPGSATPSPGWWRERAGGGAGARGAGWEGGLHSQSARVCLRSFLREVGRV